MTKSKTSKRKTQRRQPLPPVTCYVAASSAKGELMLLEYALRTNITELDQAVAKVVKQLDGCRSTLRAFQEKLQERKAT